MSSDLVVEGDVDVDADGLSFRLVGDGDRLIVAVPTLSAALKLRRRLHRGSRRPRSLSAPVRLVLSRTGLRADVEVDGVRVATVAPDRDPGLLGSFLGTTPARPVLTGLVRALVPRR